jgi:hypothetical protein
VELFVQWQHNVVYAKLVELQADFERKDVGFPLTMEDAIRTKEVLDGLTTECVKVKLDPVVDLIGYTLVPVEHCIESGTGLLFYSEMVERIKAIDYLFNAQGSKQIFFRLTPEESAMFDKKQLFGAGVATAFPSDEATYEIMEAGNCLALGRPTATVFHLMRVLEKGLKALAANLDVQFSIPFDYLNWQNIIEQIESEIKKLGQQPAGQTKTDTLKSYSEIAKQFRYFKDAWRNGVAHSRETYSPEQALSIFRHVREFMQDIVKLGLHE